MAKYQLNLGTLHELDSGVGAIVFNREFEKAVADCRDRPALAKPREIIVKVKVSPHKVDSEDVVCQLEVCGCKMPGSSTDPVRMQTDARNKASFQSLTNENPRQSDLGFEETTRPIFFFLGGSLTKWRTTSAGRSMRGSG